MTDNLQSFIINETEYRGVLVHLTDCYQKIINLHAYPSTISIILGEALAAVTLLSNNLKEAGKVALQLESENFLKTLIAEANNSLGIRGLVQWRNEFPAGQLDSGKFVITYMPKKGDYYQGIVPVIDQKIAKCLEDYFTQSEQIFTRIIVACDGNKAAGLLLQKLPSATEPSLDKTTLNFLIDTLTPEELLTNTNEQLLHKLFHENTLRLFDVRKVDFECTCNREKMNNVVRMLSPEEVTEILSMHKNVVVTCEFCNDHYAFTQTEIEQLKQ